MDRREAIKTLSLGTLAGTFALTGCKNSPEEEAKQLQDKFWSRVTEEELEMWETRFFTDHEFETVRRLSNLIIPADERSGSAVDAGVPEFIDFMMLDRPGFQTPIRGGLNWLDYQCQTRYNADFVDCSEQQQTEMLDRIAYPETAEPGMQAGVNFFNQFRDLVASGFWSSKMGIEDIGYIGNQPYDWQGCPDEAHDHLGISPETNNQST